MDASMKIAAMRAVEPDRVSLAIHPRGRQEIKAVMAKTP
jgi:hypothetical protein